MFRNRGAIPDINIGEDNQENKGYSVPHYTNYWNGNYIVIHYDKTFVAIELITISLIMLVALAVYLFVYQVPFNDPIANMKKTFITFQLISIGVSLGLTCLVPFLTKSKEGLIRNLRIVAILSILMIITQLGVKLYMDNRYNEKVFEEFYETYEKSSNSADQDSKRISLGLAGIKVSDLKEAYIEDSVSAYTNFKAKTIFYMILHILIVIIVFYLSSRLSFTKKKKKQLSKDDAILYDEEENVKF